jgi:hypothetical protein
MNLSHTIKGLAKKHDSNVSVAEVLQKGTMSVFYDPDSYREPSLTVFLQIEIPSDGKMIPYEIEMNTEQGVVNDDTAHAEKMDPDKYGAIDCLRLPVILTTPLPGRNRQPRFDEITPEKQKRIDEWFGYEQALIEEYEQAAKIKMEAGESNED